jgi:hypothetical protein
VEQHKVKAGDVLEIELMHAVGDRSRSAARWPTTTAAMARGRAGGRDR